MMVGMVGILMAGCSYSPFAPYMPAERLEFMASDLDASVVLTVEKHQKLAGSIGVGCVLRLDKDIDQAAVKKYQLPEMGPTQNMMCLYTSGSTGTPKAVALSHQAPGQGPLKVLPPYQTCFALVELFWHTASRILIPKNGTRLQVVPQDGRGHPRTIPSP